MASGMTTSKDLNDVIRSLTLPVDLRLAKS